MISPVVVDPCHCCMARHACAFSRLEADERRLLQALATTRYYDRGTVLVRQGDAAGGVHIVKSGVLRLLHVTASGKSATVKVLGPGGMLGVTEAISDSRFLMSAETVEASSLEYLERGRLLAFLGRQPRIAVELLRWISAKHHETLQEWYDAMSKSSLTARLLGNLRDMGETCGRKTQEGVALSRHLTVRDLAHGLGCSRQWTSKLLGELEEEGRIWRRGRQIILPSGLSPRPPGPGREFLIDSAISSTG